MTKHNELATAIETGDAAKLERLLVEHADLANSPEWSPYWLLATGDGCSWRAGVRV